MPSAAPTQHLVAGTLAAYDPYRLCTAIGLFPGRYEGALIKAAAAIQPSIGLLPVTHPLVSRASHIATVERVESLGSGAIAKEVQQLPAHRPIHGADAADFHAHVERLQSDNAYNRRAMRAMVALSTHAPLWQEGMVSTPTFASRLPLNTPFGTVVPFFQGPQPTGATINLANRNQPTTSPDGPSQALHALTEDGSHDRLIHHVADRFNHLARIVLGIYDFYGLHHDRGSPYMVEPEVAIERGLRPRPSMDATELEGFLQEIALAHPELADAAGQGLASFPNPYHVLRPGDLPAPIVSDLSMASSPLISPVYRHPDLSQDYGLVPWLPRSTLVEGDQPLYRARGPITGGATQRPSPKMENGQLGVDFPEFPGPAGTNEGEELILCHTSWLDTGSLDRALASRATGEADFDLDKTPEHLMPYSGFLPVDQLLAACTLSLHSNDLGQVEAAMIMNPMSLVAAAHLVGVERTLINRYLVAWGTENGMASAKRVATDPALLTSNPAQRVETIQALVVATVRKHATNILERHPELLSPCVAMPLVRLPQHLQLLNRGSGLSLNANITTVVPNLYLADIPLPTGTNPGRFANNPHVKAGLGDRRPEQMVPANPFEYKPCAKGTLIAGLPFVATEYDNEMQTPRDHVAPSDPRRSQLVNAHDHFRDHVRPYNFIASVFELNTHVDEFIAHQDQLKAYLRGLDPHTGQSSSPAPSTTPFQLVPASAWLTRYHSPDALHLNATDGGDGFKPKELMGRRHSQVVWQIENTKSARSMITGLLLGPSGLPPTYLTEFYLGAGPGQLRANSPTRLEPVSMQRIHDVVAETSPSVLLHKLIVPQMMGYIRFVRALHCNVGGGVVAANTIHESVLGLPDTPGVTGMGRAGICVAAILHGAGFFRTRTGAMRAIVAKSAYNMFCYQHELDGIFSYHADACPALGAALDASYSRALDQLQPLSTYPDMALYVNMGAWRDHLAGPGNKAFVGTFNSEAAKVFMPTLTARPGTTPPHHEPCDPTAQAPHLRLGVLADIDDLSPGLAASTGGDNPFAHLMRQSGVDPRSQFAFCGPALPIGQWNNLARHGAGALFSGFASSEQLREQVLIGAANSTHDQFPAPPFSLRKANTNAVLNLLDEWMRVATDADTGVKASMMSMVDERALVGVPVLSAQPVEDGQNKGEGWVACVAVGAYATTGRGNIVQDVAAIARREQMTRALQAAAPSEVRPTVRRRI